MKAILILLVLVLAGVSYWLKEQVDSAKSDLITARINTEEALDEKDLVRLNVIEMQRKIDDLEAELKTQKEMVAGLEAKHAAEMESLSDAASRQMQIQQENFVRAGEASQRTNTELLAELDAKYQEATRQVVSQRATLVANGEKIELALKQLERSAPELDRKGDPFARNNGVRVSDVDRQKEIDAHQAKVAALQNQKAAIKGAMIEVEARMRSIQQTYETEKSKLQ